MSEDNKPSIAKALIHELGIDVHDIIEDRQERISDSEKPFEEFLRKWSDRIGKTRIDLFDIPASWFRVIDAFLQYMYEVDPDAKVLQLKYKFGGVRLYVETSVEEIQEQVHDLEKELYDERLIY